MERYGYWLLTNQAQYIGTAGSFDWLEGAMNPPLMDKLFHPFSLTVFRFLANRTAKLLLTTHRISAAFKRL